MVANEKIIKEIKDRVEKISTEKLERLLEYIKELELSDKQTDNNSVLKIFWCLERYR